jgi:hypothetical protein
MKEVLLIAKDEKNLQFELDVGRIFAEFYGNLIKN